MKTLKLMCAVAAAVCISLSIFVFQSEASGQGPGPVAQQEAVVPDPKPPGRIEYINPNPPKFRMPEYRGQSYEALVPATLDLAERARLASNAATGMLNPNSDYQLYWRVNHMADPPVMVHGGTSDLIGVGKFLEVIPLMRTMSGNKQGAEAERVLLLNALRDQGPDGMLYLPVGGRPYVLPERFDPLSGWPGRDSGIMQVGSIGYGNVRALGALCLYAQKDPAGPWKEAARRLAEAFKKTIIVDGDIAYNFKSFMVPGEKVVKPEHPPVKMLGAMSAWVAWYLVMYDRAMGDPEATQLAAKMMRYNMGPLNHFDDRGKFLVDWIPTDAYYASGGPAAHFHTHATNILAALAVAERLGDKWMLERALAAYEWGKSPEARGSSILGFFAEAIFEKLKPVTSEICGVSDMIVAAIMLSRQGIDRWDDADRWVRNQLAEGQLTSTDWRTDGHIPTSELFKGADPYLKADWVEGRYTTARVLERTLGSFSGWPSANDWVGHREKSITIANCCSASGMRALYYVWRNILDYEPGKLRVNLLLNRASRWADVDSYIPYEGRVEVKMKQGAEVEVRIPEWAPLDQVRCEVDGKARKLTFEGRYARVGKAEKGETVALRFPIRERTDKVSLQGTGEYTIVRRGNDVVWIDPPGKYFPSYQRGHYRTGQPLYRKVVRFVSDEDFGWW